jgi:hypothetical protein
MEYNNSPIAMMETGLSANVFFAIISAADPYWALGILAVKCVRSMA